MRKCKGREKANRKTFMLANNKILKESYLPVLINRNIVNKNKITNIKIIKPGLNSLFLLKWRFGIEGKLLV